MTDREHDLRGDEPTRPRMTISRAEADEIYGFVPLGLRDCKHPNLAPLPVDLTSEVARVAENVGALGLMAERRCPDCGAWVRLPVPSSVDDEGRRSE